MIRATVALCLLCTWACSSAKPPAGPTHIPTDSEEAQTACPTERGKAQKARENLLGEELSSPGGQALSKEAAISVLAHGECEAAAAVAMPKAEGTHDQILAKLRAHREQVQIAIQLFREVSRYDQGSYAARASLAEAKLKLSFADSVAVVPPPADMDVQSRAAFESELLSAAQVLRQEAAALLEAVLDSTGASSELGQEACELFAASGQVSSGSCP